MIRLYLSRGNNPVQIPMQLPTTPGEAGFVFAQLDSISTRHPTHIQNIQCDVPGLFQYIRNVDIDSSDMELHDYERVTENAAEYGQEVLRRHGADEEILRELGGYMDFERYGRDSMVEDDVRQTEFGLIRRCSEPFREEQQGIQLGGM